MNKTLLVALGIVATIVAIVAVLAAGGDPPTAAGDGSSDVSLGEGENPPGDSSLADITEASVRRSGGEVVFEVSMARPIPGKGSDDSLSFRWDLTVNGKDVWLVTADTGTGPVAAISSLESNFGASTIDDTLPGSISVEGERLTVTIKVAEIDGFPADFGWKLTATLDGDRADPASAVVTDTAPDGGPGEVE